MTEDQLLIFTKEVREKILVLKNTKAVVVFLQGDLGSGKTTFTKAFALELGIEEDISSPTFVILKRYSIPNFTFTNLIHIDAYRLKNFTELEKLKIKEYLADQNNLILIEWPELVVSEELIPDLKISFTHGEKEGERIVTIV